MKINEKAKNLRKLGVCKRIDLRKKLSKGQTDYINRQWRNREKRAEIILKNSIEEKNIKETLKHHKQHLKPSLRPDLRRKIKGKVKALGKELWESRNIYANSQWQKIKSKDKDKFKRQYGIPDYLDMVPIKNQNKITIKEDGYLIHGKEVDYYYTGFDIGDYLKNPELYLKKLYLKHGVNSSIHVRNFNTHTGRGFNLDSIEELINYINKCMNDYGKGPNGIVTGFAIAKDK